MTLGFKSWRSWLPLVLVFLLAAYEWGPTLRSEFWLIDDHDIIEFLGTDHKAELAELPQQLLQGELGHPQETKRFRPVYQILRGLETVAWDRNPTPWYVVRFLGALFFFFTLLALPRSLLAPMEAFVLTLLILGQTLWSDIWTRLGTAEFYAALAMMLWLRSGYQIIKEPRRLQAAWLAAFFVSGVVAVGSKENMLFLGPLTVLGAILPSQVAPLSKRLRVLLACFGLIFSLTAVGIYFATLAGDGGAAAASDVYGNSMALGARFLLTLKSVLKVNLMSLALLLSFVPLLLGAKKSDVAKRVAFLAVIFGIYAFQVFFYNGQLPADMRYGMPGALLKPLSVFLALLFVVETIKKHPRTQPWQKWVLSVLYLGPLLFWVPSGVLANHRVSQRLSQRTQNFHRSYEELLSKLQQENASVVVEVVHIAEFEPALSIARYLKSDGHDGKLFLYVDPSTATTLTESYHTQLLASLGNISREGTQVSSPWPGNGKLKRLCLSVILRENQNPTQCPNSHVQQW